MLRGTNPRPVPTFRVLVDALVPWIWAGGFIMAVGTLIALWPAGGEEPRVAGGNAGRAAAARPRERSPELVEA